MQLRRWPRTGCRQGIRQDERAVRTPIRSSAVAFATAAAGEGRRSASYAHSLPAAYTEHEAAATAVADARVLAGLAADSAPVLTLSVVAGHEHELRLKLFGVGAETPLSAVLPVLENFGLAVRTQRPFGIYAPDGSQQWIHEFDAEHPQAQALADDQRAGHLAAAFAQVSSGEAENDHLNQLVIAAGLSPRQEIGR